MSFFQSPSPKEQYQELLSQTKLYLAQEHAANDRIYSESETYAYFKAYALEQSKKKSPLAQKIQEPAVPPLINSHVSSLDPLVAKQPSHKTQIPHVASLPPSGILTKKANESPNKIESIKPGTSRSSSPPSVKSNPPNKTFPSTKESAFFALEPLSPLPPQNFTNLRSIIKDKLPHLHLLDHIPDDTEAKNLASLWTQEKKIYEVLILSFDETPKHLTFLSHLAKALEIHGISVQVANGIKLENGNEWKEILKSKELKLVIASSSGFYHLPELQKYYREGAKHGHHHLGDCLLLLLSDMGFYLKEPALKSSLWSALKELISISRAS